MLLQKFIAAVIQGVGGTEVLRSLGVHQRVLLSLTADGRRGDLLLVLADLQDNGRSYRTEATSDPQVAGSRAAAPGYLVLLSEPIDSRLLSLGAVDLPVKAQLTRFEWAEQGTLTIGAWAYLPGINPADCELRVELRQQESATAVALAVTRGTDQRVDTTAADRFRSYAGAAFTVEVDTPALPGVQESGRSSEWFFHVTLLSEDFTASDRIRVRNQDLVPRRLPVGASLNARTRAIALMDADKGLRLKTIRYSCAASTVHVEGNVVTVGFGRTGDVVPAALYLEAEGENAQEFRQEANEPTFTLHMSRDEVPGNQEKRWTVKALLPNGRTVPVGWAGSGSDLSAVSAPSAALRMECTGYGYLQVSLRPLRLTLSSARMVDGAGTVILEGQTGGGYGHKDAAVPMLMLLTARNEVRASSARWLDNAGRFQAEFPLVQDRWGYGESALEPGHYRVLHRIPEECGGGVARVPALGGLLTSLPLHLGHDLMHLELVGEGNEQDLVLRVAAPRNPDDRTALRRSQAIADYAQTADPVDSEIVLFESFDGKSSSDSGRAISNVLGERIPRLQRYWTIADFSVPVPPGCTPVLRESPEWFKLLATAGYLVNNNNFPHYFRKRPGQFYLQTWHGTPLKRVGTDTPIAGTTASYRALISREGAVWDMLLAQNEFAADTLAAAFGYRGEPAVFGYPRNDALAADTAPARRAEARRRLGIESGKKVLLYVPTWRDNRDAANPYLDFEAAAAGLGEDYLMLYRGHHKIAGKRKTTGQDFYLDVTAHPEINDLYLAADLLVTDYSSAMFDFCVTGKPMYFLTPDLARYRDSERGFYIDLETEAPGPLVETTEELVAAIRAAEAAAEPYRSRHRKFTLRYLTADDGAAAIRVVNAVWSLTEGTTSINS
ncbi:CDP-glycerol glycerophosphotransferase family protein [Arthrobacter zhangbolii]|nr:CDP-glycerol glycerophosphotransferase family protein [Arthrobacter zhangbolii]MCC3271143.1 CDP-glycerol glycerophosphotransferase family protein [Arthrobacter zhangbolii]